MQQLNLSELKISGDIRDIADEDAGMWLSNLPEEFKMLFDSSLRELHLTVSFQRELLFPSIWFKGVIERFGSFNPDLRIYLNNNAYMESGPW